MHNNSWAYARFSDWIIQLMPKFSIFMYASKLPTSKQHIATLLNSQSLRCFEGLKAKPIQNYFWASFYSIRLTPIYKSDARCLSWESWWCYSAMFLLWLHPNISCLWRNTDITIWFCGELFEFVIMNIRFLSDPTFIFSRKACNIFPLKTSSNFNGI